MTCLSPKLGSYSCATFETHRGASRTSVELTPEAGRPSPRPNRALTRAVRHEVDRIGADHGARSGGVGDPRTCAVRTVEIGRGCRARVP